MRGFSPDRILAPALGDDIFISYSRQDGLVYAIGLAAELAARRFSCRIDLWGTDPARTIPKKLKRDLRRSSMLVLVATSGAAESVHVAEEMAEFSKTGRVIIPIGFEGVRFADGVLKGRSIKQVSASPAEPSSALWAQSIQGLPVAIEDSGALLTGKPSTSVVSRIEGSVAFQKKDVRLRKIAKIVGVALLILLTAIAIATYFAMQRGAAAIDATLKATGYLQLADKAREDARDAQTRSNDARNEARDQQRKADEATLLAVDADNNRRVAETNLTKARADEAAASKEARRQREIAVLTRVVNDAVSIAARSPQQIERAALLSIEAFRRFRALGMSPPEADYALRATTGVIPRKVLTLPSVYGETNLTRDGQYLTILGPSSSRIVNLVTAKTVLETDDRLTQLEIAPSEYRGQRLAAALLASDEIIVTDLNSALRLATWKSPGASTLAFGENGRYLAVGSSNDHVQIIDADTWRPRAGLADTLNTRVIAFSERGSYLATASPDRVRTWRRHHGGWIPLADIHQGAVEQLFFSPSGHQIIAIPGNRRTVTARLFNTADGTLLTTVDVPGFRRSKSVGVTEDAFLVALGNGVQHVEWSSGSTIIRSLTNNPRTDVPFVTLDGRYVGVRRFGSLLIEVKDAGSGRTTAVLLHSGVEPVYNSQYLNDVDSVDAAGRFIISRLDDGSLHVWENPETVGDYRWRPGGLVLGLTFSSQREAVAGVSTANTLHTWETRTGALTSLSSWELPERGVFDARISEDTSLVAIGHGAGCMAHDLARTEITSLAPGTTYSVAFSPTGTYLACGSDDGLSVWRTAGWMRREGFKVSEAVTSIAFSRDGRSLAAAGGHHLYIWDVENGLLRTSKQHPGKIKEIAFSPDANYIAAVTEGELQKPKLLIGTSFVIAKYTPSPVIVTEIKTGTEVARLNHDVSAETAVFNSDARWLVTANSETASDLKANVRVWDFKVRRIVAELSHRDVSLLAFSPDDKHLATAGADAIVKLWRSSDWKLVAEFRAGSEPKKLAFSADGKRLAAAAGGDVFAWVIDPGELVEAACRRLSRDLATSEWNVYFAGEQVQRLCVSAR
jgi:WD40 repeat protein